MIRVAGRPLSAEAEAIVRGLEGGQHVPEDAECDGCSSCPDTWPPWRPKRERLQMVWPCICHDFHPRYEGGYFATFWHWAAARWDADATLRRNWRRLPELQPDIWELYMPWERRLFWISVRLGARVLRLVGWVAS